MVAPAVFKDLLLSLWRTTD